MVVYEILSRAYDLLSRALDKLSHAQDILCLVSVASEPPTPPPPPGSYAYMCIMYYLFFIVHLIINFLNSILIDCLISFIKKGAMLFIHKKVEDLYWSFDFLHSYIILFVDNVQNSNKPRYKIFRFYPDTNIVRIEGKHHPHGRWRWLWSSTTV